MHTFDIPIRKFADEFVTLTIDDDMLQDCARHGLDQRINDATAGVKRANFESDADYDAEVRKRVGKVVDRINSGEFGMGGRKSRDPMKAKTREVAKQLAGLSADDLAAILEMVAASKAAKAESDNESVEAAA